MATYYNTNRINKPKAPPIRYIPLPKYIKGDPEVNKLLVGAGIGDMEPTYFTTPITKSLLTLTTQAYHNSLMTKKELIEVLYILLSILPAFDYDKNFFEDYAPLHRRIYRNQERIQNAFAAYTHNCTKSLVERPVLLGMFTSLRHSKNLTHDKVKPTYLLGWMLDILRYLEVTSESQAIPSLISELSLKEYLTPSWHTQYFKMKAFAIDYPRLVKSKFNKQKEALQ